MSDQTDPHSRMPVLTMGAPPEAAHGAVVLVHGRGASAADILALAREFRREDLAYWAPQAAGNTWYPNRFMEPLESNEPWLGWALAKVGAVLAEVGAAGIPPERTVLLGFSQGACLALEYGARNARRFGGLVGLSGGVIGPDDAPRNYAGWLAGTPVFLGCSDVDPHIPKERVEFSAEVLRKLGAEVTQRLYRNMAHTVNADEVRQVQALLEGL
jgi:predicted esterase